MEGEHYDSLRERFGGQDDGPDAWWWQLRQRVSQDFLLRGLEEATVDGEDDDGADACSGPASKKAMVALQVPTVGETREQGCTVCLEDFVAGGKKLRKMPCSHSFHQRCIFDWLLTSRVCPVCRFALPSLSDDDNDEQEEGTEKEARTEQFGQQLT